MSVNLLTEHHLEFLSLKGGCTDSTESFHVKMPHCWKLHVMTHLNEFIRSRGKQFLGNLSRVCHKQTQYIKRFAFWAFFSFLLIFFFQNQLFEFVSQKKNDHNVRAVLSSPTPCQA